jgi:hypothetical protein
MAAKEFVERVLFERERIGRTIVQVGYDVNSVTGHDVEIDPTVEDGPSASQMQSLGMFVC